jgi:hypothetical protein
MLWIEREGKAAKVEASSSVVQLRRSCADRGRAGVERTVCPFLPGAARVASGSRGRPTSCQQRHG